MFFFFFKQWTSRIRKPPCSPSLPDLHLSPLFPASPSRPLLPSIRCHWFRWSGWWATDSRWAIIIKRIQSKLTPEVFYTNPECQRPCITYTLSGHYSPQQLGHWCFVIPLVEDVRGGPRRERYLCPAGVLCDVTKGWFLEHICFSHTRWRLLKERKVTRKTCSHSCKGHSVGLEGQYHRLQKRTFQFNIFNIWTLAKPQRWRENYA